MPPVAPTVESRVLERGAATLEGIPAGECKVSFPTLDTDAWEVC